MRTNNVYLNTLCLAAWAPGPTTNKLAKEAIKLYDKIQPDERTTITPLNTLYVKLLQDIVDGKLDLSNRAEAEVLVRQYQDDAAFSNNKYSFEEFKSMILPDAMPSPTAVTRLVTRVKNFIVWQSNAKRIRALALANQKASFEEDEEKQSFLLKKILDDAAEFAEIYNSQNTIEEDGLAPVEDIDFDDPASIKRGFLQQERKRSGTQIKFGLQGLNRMFGPSGGAAYGEFFCVAARSHNYKSGLLMDMFRGQCVYNKPPDTGGRIPLILFISLENEIGENLKKWWRQAYINLYRKVPEGIPIDEMVEQVRTMLMKNGFHIRVMRRFGETFGFNEFRKVVEDYELKGFKVVTTYLDYLGLCHRSREDKDKRDDLQLVEMARKFKDFAQHNDMFFATGWQMDADASRISKSGITNIVKMYGESHLANAKALKQELDMLIFLEIENNAQGIPYLTCAWNKHKYVEDTPEKDKYFAYRFTDSLGVLDDVNGNDMSVSDIYGETEAASDAAQLNPTSVFQ